MIIALFIWCLYYQLTQLVCLQHRWSESLFWLQLLLRILLKIYTPTPVWIPKTWKQCIFCLMRQNRLLKLFCRHPFEQVISWFQCWQAVSGFLSTLRYCRQTLTLTLTCYLFVWDCIVIWSLQPNMFILRQDNPSTYFASWAVFPLRKFCTEQMFVLVRTQLRNHA